MPGKELTISTESPITVDISKMRASFKKRSNGRLRGLERFTKGSPEKMPRARGFSPGIAPFD